MSNKNSRYKALTEFPYLGSTKVADDPLEKEIYDYDSLRGLHEVSSDLIKNNPAAAGFALAYVNSLMGGNISFDIRGSDYIAKPLELMMKEQFKHMDINFQYNINMIFEYIVYMAFKKGDVLVNMPFDKERGEIGTMVELIDAGRISTPADLQHDSLVRNGVKYSAGGRIVGYYVEPIDKIFDFRRLLAVDYNFIPLFTRGKFGLVRQNCMMFKDPLFDEFGAGRMIPSLIPSSKNLRHMLKYIEYVVIGTQVAACFAGFITSKNPAGAKQSFDQNSRRLKHVGKLNPGGIYFLRRGEEISFGSPSRPADNMDSAVKRMSIIAAASIRLPYELGFLHLENTSFSSWKGGQNEVKANNNRWINRMEILGQFIFNNYKQEMVIKRMIKDSSKVKAVFNFPRFDSLDPEKSARADGLDLDNESTSLRKVRNGKNYDYDEVEAERTEEEIARIRRQGLMVAEKQKLEDELNIVFPEESPSIARAELERLEAGENGGESTNLASGGKSGGRDTTGSRRKGENKKGKLTEEEKLERRKKDDNF